MPPSQTNGQPDLDWIMNPAKPAKKPILPAGTSTLQRAIFVGLGLVLILIAFIVVSNLLSSGSKDQQATLLKAAQQQTELARVAQLAVTSTSQSTRSLAFNTSLTLMSDQKLLTTTLAGHGVELNPKDLQPSINQDTDKSLETAKAAANFDATFISILTDQLKAYEATLSKAYKGSKNKDVQATLQVSFTNADLLVQQAAATKP